ncbi:unnamed protein product [Prunus armeniaca]
MSSPNKVRSKLHPFAKKNLDENVLHLFENTLVLGPHCEVRNSPVKWEDWIDRLLPKYGTHWKRAGIYDAILLSKQSVNRDENLLAAALCFWNSASNTFDFRVGPMALTLLDMAQIFGFRPHGRPIDAVGDYHRRKNQQKLAKPFTISPALINQNCSFSNYLRKFNAEKDKDQQHMLFLLYWLNKFILPNCSSAVLLEYRHLAEALYNHTIWLQVFPELRFPDIVLPEDQVLAQPLMLAEVPKRSLEEYLMFFRHCTKRSAAQWQLVIRRTYPWFQPGYRLFEKEPEEKEAIIDFRKKSHGGGKPPNYHLGAEVYHPNFCARQLGCPQLIPLKSYRSCNRASSWRDLDDLEVHKDARCAVNKINNSADALYPSWESNSCSSADFDAWWKARFRNLPASSTALTIKDINAQVLGDPSVTQNVGGQFAQAGEVFGEFSTLLLPLPFPAGLASDIVISCVVTFVISVGDLELPSGEEEDEILAEQLVVEATPSARKKRKETAPPQDNILKVLLPFLDDELREAFEVVEQEKELEALEEVGEGPQEKPKIVEEEEEIPAEVIAESIALA